MSEKLCLQWNDFQAHISGYFKDLKDEQDFHDVSIACDESKQFRAHKVVLSAVSPVFRNLLKQSGNKDILVYLKGVKQSQLCDILEFIYKGSVNVYQENLEDFLSVAEELKLKGLTADSRQEEMVTKKSFSDDKIKEKLKPHVDDSSVSSILDQYHKNGILSKTETSIHTELNNIVVTNDFVEFEDDKIGTFSKVELYGDYQIDNKLIEDNKIESVKLDILDGKDLESVVESIIEKTEGNWNCIQCGKSFRQKCDVKRHAELHIEGVSHKCQKCGDFFNTRHNLSRHITNRHK